MSLLDRVATKYLVWRGYQVGASIGVTLSGNCIAYTNKDGTKITEVLNPSGNITVILGSMLFDEDDYAQEI